MQTSLNNNRQVTLFCFPHAGGSSYSYLEFQRNMPDFINLFPLDLPGRGRKFSEPLLKDIYEMAAYLFDLIRKDFKEPYAFFGHSMGAWIGYLLVKRIIDESLPLPVHLFFSGREGPSVDYKRYNRHLLPREEFIEVLKKFGGAPSEVIDNKDLMDLFEPVIRADFEAIEKFTYKKSTPFNIPITVMIGLEEDTTYDEAMKWQDETMTGVELIQFPGNHFFIFEHLPEVGRIISKALYKAVNH